MQMFVPDVFAYSWILALSPALLMGGHAPDPASGNPRDIVVRSPQRRSAPEGYLAFRSGDARRQVSWLAFFGCVPPSRGGLSPQWLTLDAASRSQLRGQLRRWPLMGTPHRIPFWPPSGGTAGTPDINDHSTGQRDRRRAEIVPVWIGALDRRLSAANAAALSHPGRNHRAGGSVAALQTGALAASIEIENYSH